MIQDPEQYEYSHSECGCAHRYLLPEVGSLIGRHRSDSRVLDLGCGNGAVAAHLAEAGYEVVGVEPSRQGVEQARQAFPNCEFHEGSAYDDLAAAHGTFPILISLEVVEHVYYPRKFANCVYDLLEPGGCALISTPYHGYLKNLAIALFGKFDAHVSPLWTHGHIKFWSEKTLRILLEEAGLVVERFVRVGRVRPLAKSMIAVARKPK